MMHVRYKVQTELRPDGRWDAWYSIYDWRETAPTREGAILLASLRSQRFCAEHAQARASLGQEAAEMVLCGEDVPGVSVEFVSEQEYFDFMFKAIINSE